MLAFDVDADLTIYRNGEPIDASTVPGGRDKFTIIPSDSDEVIEHDDGTTTVYGFTGSSPSAGGDMWMVDGDIPGLSTDAGVDCYVDGDSVSPGSF